MIRYVNKLKVENISEYLNMLFKYFFLMNSFKKYLLKIHYYIFRSGLDKLRP